MDRMKLESLKARIRRSEYVVDPEAVAEAILRRVMAARQPPRAPRLGGKPGPGTDGSGSGDVLEPG